MIRTAVGRWGCDEYCNASEGASLSETAASQSRWGDRTAVRWQAAVLSVRRQGSGQVRDAAGSCGRWAQCYRCRRDPRLLPPRLLSGGRFVCRSGHDGAARRTAWPAWATQAQCRDPGLHKVGGSRLVQRDGRAGDHAAVCGCVASAHRRARSSAMRTLWPVTEPIQAEYESLRALALADADLCGLPALRFAQQGLVGLIAWRRIESPFSVSLVGAQRPPWTPYTDPRLDALAELYEFLLGFCPERIEAV